MKNFATIFLLLVGLFTFPATMYFFDISALSILGGIFAGTGFITIALLSEATKNEKL